MEVTSARECPQFRHDRAIGRCGCDGYGVTTGKSWSLGSVDGLFVAGRGDDVGRFHQGDSADGDSLAEPGTHSAPWAAG